MEPLVRADPLVTAGLGRDEPPTLAVLYDAYVEAVELCASRLPGPDIDVEDIVHVVFRVARRKLGQFREQGQTASWLFRITTNIVRHRRRKERWRKWLGGSAEDVAGGIAANRPTPIEQMERRENIRAVYRVL